MVLCVGCCHCRWGAAGDGIEDRGMGELDCSFRVVVYRWGLGGSLEEP